MSDLVEGEPKMPPQISPKDLPGETQNSESEEEEPVAVVFEDSTSSDEDGDDGEGNDEGVSQGYVPLSQEDNELQVADQSLPLVEEQAPKAQCSQADDCNEESRINGPTSSSGKQPKMEQAQVDLIRQVMSGITLPNSAIPEWAKTIPEDKWKASLITSITNRVQSPPGNGTKK